jgi:pimeloyl-ACP methyl ester carboxylesterase
MDTRRGRAHGRLAALPGVRAVRRPATRDGDDFDLYYVRAGTPGREPLVIVPGGPGMASIGPYQGLRRRATAAGLDVIMVEHRGVGLSRRADSGADLPPAALTIEQSVDDIAAVLDDAGVDRAVVYGTSYGTYLAAGLGVRHPDRVAGMVLDSPVMGGDDIDAIRQALRGLLWDGASLSTKVRRLDMSPTDAYVAATVYGLGGEDLLHRHLDLLLDGRRLLWRTLHHITFRAAHWKMPYHNESDLVGPIGFRELNYAGTPDGLPLDPAIAMRELAAGDTEFAGEPFDLVAAMPSFDWPTVVISGGRDLTTPPSVAERIVGLIPGATLVRMPTVGHSVLDTRERAALQIAAEVCAGHASALAGQGDTLDSLPTSPAAWLAASALGVATRAEALLPKLVNRPTS